MPKSLEEFDRETAAKRAELERQLELVKALPTTGRRVTWVGENGWDENGQAREPIEKSIELVPWIVHGRFRGADHIVFRPPAGGAGTGSGEGGEHVSSPYRGEFARRYLAVIVEALEGYVIPTVAIRSAHYASYVWDGYDYRADRDYADARETARGGAVVRVQNHTGEHGFTSAKLEFYIIQFAQPRAHVTKVDVELGSHSGLPFPYRLMPQARRSSDHRLAEVASWVIPGKDQVGAVEMFRRSSADRNSHGCARGYTVEYLFPTLGAALKACDL